MNQQWSDSSEADSPVTRLTGLLGLKELSDAIARELISRNLHSPLKQVCYSDYEMADLFENFHQELLQSDRRPKPDGISPRYRHTIWRFG